MRIGFFTDFYRPQITGISYSIDSFRHELEKLGHEVYIFAPAPGFNYKEKEKHIVRFPAVKGLFFGDYLTSLFFPPQAARKIEKLNLDIVHFHTPSQVGLMGVYFAIHHNLPLVTTYHTDLFEYVKHYPAVLPGVLAMSLLVPAITSSGLEEYRTALSSIKPERSIDKWNQKLVERGVTVIHNHCDLVITPSRKMERQLKSWKTTSPIATLPTGVVEVPTVAKDLAWAKDHYHIDKDDQIILFVGRLASEKNIKLLLEAFGSVAKKRPQARLFFVGDGPDRAELAAAALKSSFNDRVVITGFLDRGEVGALYQLASVFAFPSLADTQGLVLNEAAAAGLPIVMIDREVAEVVRQGYNGLYAKNTAKDFAAKLLTILNQPGLQSELGRHGQALAGEFLPAQQTQKLLALYQEVLHRHGQAAPRPRSRWRPRRDS